MGKLGIGADTDYLGAGGLEILVLICQISVFRSSDKGKISRVKEKNRPFSGLFQLLQGNFAKGELSGNISFHLEILHLLSHLDTMIMSACALSHNNLLDY